MAVTKAPVKIIPDRSGPALSIAGGSYRIVTTGQQTGGAYGIIEMLVPPGGGPGPHAHADFEETFHMLEGEVEFQSEDGKAIARTGDFIRIPQGGIIHGFKNKSSAHPFSYLTEWLRKHIQTDPFPRSGFPLAAIPQRGAAPGFFVFPLTGAYHFLDRFACRSQYIL